MKFKRILCILLVLAMVVSLMPVSASAAEDISDSFTDPNFKQAVWEWLGNPVGSTPGSFSTSELSSVMGSKSCLLDVRNKNISSLAGIENFEGIGLQEIQCSQNLLTTLPTLPNGITTLYCSQNQLSSLPPLPASLTTLDCANNFLTSLPEFPLGLTFINCSVNELMHLPSLSGLGALGDLYCNDNYLVSLPTLPDHLAQLIAHNNFLTSLPALPNSLTYLSIGGNQLTSLPVLPTGLKSLDCRTNWLASLPELPLGLTFLACKYNYLNVWSGDLKTKVESLCIPSQYTPQRRLQYTGSPLSLDIAMSQSAQLLESSLQRVASTDGVTWENGVNSDLNAISFSSSDSTIAVVNAAGLITPKAAGSCTIFALYGGSDTEYTKASIPVTVTNSTPSYTVSIGSLSGGTITANPSTALAGSTITLTITPNAGMKIADGTLKYSDGTLPVLITGTTFTMPAASITVTADFISTSSGSGGGSNSALTSVYVQDQFIVEKPAEVTVDLTQNSTKVSAAQMSALIQANSEKPVTLKGKDYTITFEKGSLKADSAPYYDFDVKFVSGSNDNRIRELAGSALALIVSYSHSGKLPAEATITLKVGANYSGKTLYYYYYNTTTGELEYLQSAVVDANGYVTVKQTHCSDYVFTDEKLSADDADIVKIPDTGDTTFVSCFIENSMKIVEKFNAMMGDVLQFIGHLVKGIGDFFGV